jgi:hypothetical protein
VPDAQGNFKGISVPASAWERVFGSASTDPAWDDHETHLRMYREWFARKDKETHEHTGTERRDDRS